jgi:uncharacterized membrane protein YdfJ with MMPL/SSD domain
MAAKSVVSVLLFAVAVENCLVILTWIRSALHFGEDRYSE